MQSLRYPLATLLEQAHFESEHHFDANEIRSLLTNHAPEEGIVLYGSLLRQLLSRIKNDVVAQPGDAELLLGYCAATLELPIDSLFESHEFDGEEAFRGAVYHADKYENPIHQGLEFCRFFLRHSLLSAAKYTFGGKLKYDQMMAVLTELFTPENRHGLHPVLELALAQRGSALNVFFQLPEDFYLNETAYQAQQPVYREKIGVRGIVLRALTFAIAKGPWLPPNASANSLTWGVYHSNRGNTQAPKPALEGDDLHEAQLVRRLLSGYPDQHRYAFEAFSQRKAPSENVVRSLFPICIPMLDTGPFAKELLRFLMASQDWDGGASGVLMQEMRSQHPDLMELLELHSQLYMDAEQACENFGALVEPLQRLAAGNLAVDLVALPEL